MQQELEQLYSGTSLTFEQMQSVFSKVMQGQLTEIELSALLVALKIKGETAAEIAGAAQAMRANALSFNNIFSDAIDSCGTGGDGANTINISTTAALVGASCGLKMVKHGNRSVSSQSGAADLVKTLGINIEMSPEQGANGLEKTGFSFLFAPVYHSGVKHAMGVRTTLKTRTIFNILGPLANPAQPKFQLLGVYRPELCRLMAETLQQLGCERAMVVHGAGTDEIALHGETQVAELIDGQVKEYTLTPEQFGLTHYPLAALAGASPEQNAKATLAILQGKGAPAHNAAIIANVAALLYLTGRADSLVTAAEQVSAVLKSGVAYTNLQHIIECSHG